MKESFQSNLRKPWLFPVLLIVLGLFLLFKPGTALKTVVRLAGAALLIGGVNAGVSWYQRRHEAGVTYLDAAGGALGIIGGLYLLFKPESLVNLFPTIAGIAMIAYGVFNILKALDQKKAGFSQWTVSCVMAGVTIILGIILVSNPFGVMETVVRIFGIFLLYNGFSSLWITTR